jgi:hypothetical protein
MFHSSLLTIIPEGVESETLFWVQCTDGRLEGSALRMQGPCCTDPRYAPNTASSSILHSLVAPRNIHAEARASCAEGARQRDRKQSFNYECPECRDLFKAPRQLAKHCGRYDCSFMAQGRKAGDFEGFEWVREPDLERLERSQRAVNEGKKTN